MTRIISQEHFAFLIHIGPICPRIESNPKFIWANKSHINSHDCCPNCKKISIRVLNLTEMVARLHRLIIKLSNGNLFYFNGQLDNIENEER